MMKNNLPAKYLKFAEITDSYDKAVDILGNDWFEAHLKTKAEFVAIYTNNRHDQKTVFSVFGLYIYRPSETVFYAYSEIANIRAACSIDFGLDVAQTKKCADVLLITMQTGKDRTIFFDGSRGPSGVVKDPYEMWHLIRILKKRFSVEQDKS